MATNGTEALRALASGAEVRAVKSALSSAAGAGVYIVGGAVRDALLGRTPTDVDVLVRGVLLGELRRLLAAAGDVRDVGTRFGVLLFRPAGSDSQVDVALPRTERSSGRGGYRDVAAASDPGLPVEADLGRRDFTINALAYDVLHARLIDPFDGRSDLRTRTIRTVGQPSRRFAEDRSRILRAVRLAAQLGFSIEPATLTAIRELAPLLNEEFGTLGGVRRVVPSETIGREFFLALTAAPRRTVELLDESGLLPHVLPELEHCRGIEQFAEYHPEGDVFVHTKDILDRLPDNANGTLTLATLCHDLGKAAVLQVKVLAGPRAGERVTIRRPHEFFAAGRAGVRGGYDPATMQVQHIGHELESERLTRGVIDRLVLTQFANDPNPRRRTDRSEVLHAVRHHLLQNIGEMRPSKAERILLRPDGSVRQELLDLARIDPTPPRTGRYDAALARVQEFERDTAPLITGRDLIAAGFAPGPQIGVLLAAVRDEQLSGNLTDAESALAWVRTRSAVPHDAAVDGR